MVEFQQNLSLCTVLLCSRPDYTVSSWFFLGYNWKKGTQYSINSSNYSFLYKSPWNLPDRVSLLGLPQSTRLDGLNNRNLFSHNSGDRNLRSKYYPCCLLARVLFLVCRRSPSCYFLSRPFIAWTQRKRTGEQALQCPSYDLIPP